MPSMSTSETARESSASRFSRPARSSSAARAVSGASSGLSEAEPWGDTSSGMRGSIDDVIHGRFLHLPTACLVVIAGESEAVPILVVEPRMIGAIVITGPACFLSEQGVLRHAFGG